jgi:hypothetical protein
VYWVVVTSMEHAQRRRWEVIKGMFGSFDRAPAQ